MIKELRTVNSKTIKLDLDLGIVFYSACMASISFIAFSGMHSVRRWNADTNNPWLYECPSMHSIAQVWIAQKIYKLIKL